jgi:hypothetical protein
MGKRKSRRPLRMLKKPKIQSSKFVSMMMMTHIIRMRTAMSRKSQIQMMNQTMKEISSMLMVKSNSNA